MGNVNEPGHDGVRTLQPEICVKNNFAVFGVVTSKGRLIEEAADTL